MSNAWNPWNISAIMLPLDSIQSYAVTRSYRPGVRGVPDARSMGGSMPEDIDSLHPLRLQRWHQTADTKIDSPSEAAALIRKVGIATAFPTSPEIPNLYHAHVGDPDRKTEAEWNT